MHIFCPSHCYLPRQLQVTMSQVAKKAQLGPKQTCNNSGPFDVSELNMWLKPMPYLGAFQKVLLE